MVAVKNYGCALKFVPAELRSAEIYMTAVTQSGWALIFVPSECRTAELCMIAVKNYGLALKFVPAELRSAEICLAAVQSDGRALEFVPVCNHTEAICKAALAQTPEAERHLSLQFRYLVDGPIEFSDPPADICMDELEDPIELGPLIKGRTYGFIIQHDKWYVAGSLELFNKLATDGFRGSTRQHVFVPLLNRRYPMKDI
jgi:hypothetical protein